MSVKDDLALKEFSKSQNLCDDGEDDHADSDPDLDLSDLGVDANDVGNAMFGGFRGLLKVCKQCCKCCCKDEDEAAENLHDADQRGNNNTTADAGSASLAALAAMKLKAKPSIAQQNGIAAGAASATALKE